MGDPSVKAVCACEGRCFMRGQWSQIVGLLSLPMNLVRGQYSPVTAAMSPSPAQSYQRTNPRASTRNILTNLPPEITATWSNKLLTAQAWLGTIVRRSPILGFRADWLRSR